jgi:hypothetical protein
MKTETEIKKRLAMDAAREQFENWVTQRWALMEEKDKPNLRGVSNQWTGIWHYTYSETAHLFAAWQAGAASKHFPEADSAVGQSEAKAGHFDICKEMARRSMDIRMSLLENVTNVSYSKRTKGTTVSIGVHGNLVAAIGLDNKFVGGLLLCDREQYYAIARELEAVSSTQPSTTESKK